MSQFDLPRLSFHGTAFLDTPTANNGNYEPNLTLFDQNESEAFLPPRCYLPKGYTYIPPENVHIIQDDNGNSYVPVSPVTTENYQQWATTPLGSFNADMSYWSLYDYLSLKGKNPGYWNYYGDLSISLINTQVTGVTLPSQGDGVVTYTPQNHLGCPSDIYELLGAELSFNNEYFSEGSRTTAYLCDVDSMGQMCTQIFCSHAGLYKRDEQGNQITFFSGTPVKSTSRWMNLSKVLNYSDFSLVPMGGSACFYAMIALNEESDLSNKIQKISGKMPEGLFLKLLIHEVHEIREPDYTKLPTVSIYDLFGNQSNVKKNPAAVSVSGTITPYFDGDMKTTSIGRLFKNSTALSINVTDIPKPVTKSGKVLAVSNSINLAPVQFLHNQQFNLLSIDVINTINEYGTNPGALPDYAGDDDIPAYQNFDSYNFGQFFILFQPDIGGTPIQIGKFDFENNYNMQQLLSTGGMVDIKINASADFSKGYFYITLNNATVFIEDEYFITSDQMGNYAQQFQPSNNYMSDGLPKIPCTLRVFKRGVPVAQNNSVPVTMQAINMRTVVIKNTQDFMIYDSFTMNFDVDTDGCMTYGFIDKPSQIWDGTLPKLFQYAMNTSLIVVRTLEANLHLEEYLSGQLPLTWDVVFKNVFSLFKVLYPVMDAVIPFTEANWSNPFILNKMLVLIDVSNWNQPLYMPVTRDLSVQQQQLLQRWANQILHPTQNV